MIAAYESGASVNDIAVDFGVAELTVKCVLAKHADRLKSQAATLGSLVATDENGAPVNVATPKNKRPLFSEEECAIAKNVILELAQGAEMEGVRLKAAERIIDEYKGRKDVMAVLGNGDFNINVVNNIITKGLDAAAASRQRLRDNQKKVIDVSTAAAPDSCPAPAPQI